MRTAAKAGGLPKTQAKPKITQAKPKAVLGETLTLTLTLPLPLTMKLIEKPLTLKRQSAFFLEKKQMTIQEMFLAKMPESCRKSFEVETLTIEDQDRRKAASWNETPGDLADGIDCQVCRNKGTIAAVRPGGGLYMKECDCMTRRRNLRLLKASGLENLVRRYTFGQWRVEQPWQGKLMEKALEYAVEPHGWFFLSGGPGRGKTHICTAICAELMERGLPVRYLLWRDFSVQAKAVVNDADQYKALLEPAKRVKILYIDDFFKTGSKPTTADVNLAFELVNYRYNDENKFTLISSEHSADELSRIDEALGSRIWERAKGHYYDLSRYQNYRLKG